MLKGLRKKLRYGITSIFSPDTLWRNPSFSQEGEDKLLTSLLYESGNLTKKGFYIDIGAHHPFRFSNTYKFYLNGWSGINIDAMPGSMRLFNKYRPRDINIEIGIGSRSEEAEFFCFQEKAFNTFSESLANKYLSEGQILTHRIKVMISPLAEILKRYINKSKQIDFLNIDVEGHDFEVLKSNDWGRFKPNYILIEIHHCSLQEIFIRPETIFLKEYGYQLLANTCNTWIFGKKKY